MEPGAIFDGTGEGDTLVDIGTIIVEGADGATFIEDMLDSLDRGTLRKGGVRTPRRLAEGKLSRRGGGVSRPSRSGRVTRR